jgi:hypothetical protein
MDLWHYAHSGMRIASELQLPEWSQCEQGAALEAPDVVVRLYPSTSHAESATGDRLLSITAGEYRFRIPEVGFFHVLDGREIHVEASATADPARVRAWLLGKAWGALCYQRDLFILHASAVRIDNGAVLFFGQAGRGKSTLAAQLGTRGCSLVSDDLCRLDLSVAGSPIVYPSPPRVKLWSDALGELGWTDRELVPDHLRHGKFHLPVTGQGLAQPIPVRAAYLLAWGEFGVRELKGMAGFRHFLAAATYRMPMLESMGRAGRHSHYCMEFLRRTPLAELARPRDFRSSATTLNFLAETWPGAAV